MRIEQRIAFIRNHKVMLDADLAALYGVTTGVLVQAVRRNLARFPDDFLFQLNAEEWAVLRSQSVISNAGRGGRRYAKFPAYDNTNSVPARLCYRFYAPA